MTTIIQLSDERDELGCEWSGVDPVTGATVTCGGDAYPFGAEGFSGYVTTCSAHALRVVEIKITTGAMQPEENTP